MRGDGTADDAADRPRRRLHRTRPSPLTALHSPPPSRTARARTTRPHATLCAPFAGLAATPHPRRTRSTVPADRGARHADEHAATTDESTDRPDGTTGGRDGWTVVETPTDDPLFEVVATVAGPCAVGTDGTVLVREDGTWTVAVPDGPATQQNTLTCAAATADRERVWFAGSSGALGCYDVATGRKCDYSAPLEKTSTWEAVAVAGDRGAERLRVANGSGEVLGVSTDDHGCPSWHDVVEPGGGSSISALDADDGRFYAVDTSGNVFEECEDGWRTIGVRNAQVDFLDLDATDGRLLVAGDDGRAFRYDRTCENWTPVVAGGGTLLGIDRADRVLAVGDGGRAFERTGDAGWTEHPVPADGDLHAVADGDPVVAVGDGGTILEHSASADRP